MPTTTGLIPFLGNQGTHYVHELTRRAMRVTAEMNSEAVPSTDTPFPVTILRRVQTAAGDPSQGIEPTYAFAPGLTDLFGAVVLPAAWNKEQPKDGGVILKTNQRVVLLVDVPSAGGVDAGSVLLSDQLILDDPVYGSTIFDVTELLPSPGPNIVRVVATYAREGT